MSEDIKSDLIEAIQGLDKNESSHFTKAGVPDCRHLTEALGRTVKTGERDEAWAFVQENAKETSSEAVAEDGGAEQPEDETSAESVSDNDSSDGDNNPPLDEKHATPEDVVGGAGFEFIGTYPDSENNIECRGYVFMSGHSTLIPESDVVTIAKLRANPTFKEAGSAD